ncbi:hypothetical protein KSZ_25740 [Dictyobacter formicarum]|uniref:Uncharacterized protein n=1 Tax=Dictyobacter formicarum TaxID=2778368 RepID=A0ABQ3VFH7_9CHLR|nr:hypothetical protein KSZ_25740 [Dictyobacter formicarum]
MQAVQIANQQGLFGSVCGHRRYSFTVNIPETSADVSSYIQPRRATVVFSSPGFLVVIPLYRQLPEE